MLNKKTKITEEFDWQTLENRSKKGLKKPNPAILEKYGVHIYNHEPYALEYYEMVFLGQDFHDKEPRIGESRRITGVLSVSNREIVVSLSGFLDAVLDPKGEKLFCSTIDTTPEGLVEWLKTEEGVNAFLSQNFHVVIEATSPFVKASISKGQREKMKEEFFAQIKKPSSAYYGKIIEKNGGGFMINVSGVNGFLPGSLAATNIVRDFDSMIGKEIPVVVEDYLKDSDTFVFSYKKYVSMILPTKIDELDMDKKYSGTVTGVAKYGVFVEFDDIFTGLIHTSKMTPECKDRFTKSQIKAGEVIDFWIKEITTDKKIILTDEDPSVRRAEIEEFKEKNLGTIKGGEVISVQPFGTLVKLQKDIVGLISQKEIKTKKKNFSIGQTVMVSIDRVHNDKIFLSLPAES